MIDPQLPDPDNRWTPADSETDTALMSAQLCNDLVQRWQRGERVPVEAYLRQHPELENAECAFELVLTEVVLRREQGEQVPLAEFIWRFPRFEQRLRRHFALHVGLAAASTPVISSTPLPRVATPVVIPEQIPSLPGYEVVAPIGRGGMGIVYKARDVSLGRFVALKLIREEHARHSERLARFLREARTASALNHPGICTVHALGELPDGRPFIVMELVEGLTLRAIAMSRSAPDEVIRFIGQAALALAAAHAAGVVHRDIKPENIMTRADGHVKVLDFGLARLLPESILSTELVESDSHVMAGTIAYMSPEQARSESVGSPSDVFSLGVVAYELITGKHPFATESAHSTFHAISSLPPVPPRRINPLISHEIEGLLLQMLEKDFRLRPTAAEVAAAFGHAPGAPERAPRLTSVRRPRQTVGRDADRQLLWAAFEQAEAGAGLLQCVTGEPGIGKTTLVEDWLHELTANGRAGGIGRGHCSERLAGTESYLPVFEALEGLLRGESGSLAARIMRDFAPTWYAQIAPFQGDSAIERLAARAEHSTQERMKREFLAFVAEMGRRRPLVFFFDDLHWADASTIDILAWLGRRATGLRLLVVVTYRPSEMLAGDNPFVPLQLELQRHGVCRELPLAFLTDSEVGSYLNLVFGGHQFSRDFVEKLRTTTEGNPLFLVELLHHLTDCGVIARPEGTWKLVRPLPDLQEELPVSVRSLIEKQLRQLDREDHRLLSAGSVQGDEFDAALVADALGWKPAEAEERLAELDRVQGLVRLMREIEFPDGSVSLRYRFVHVLYQNVLYAAISPSRRAEWSARIAERLLAGHGKKAALVASELAFLFESARDWARAAEYFYLAAKYPLRLRAHSDAAALARRGLQVLQKLPESPDRARQEVRLQFALGISLQPTEGFAAPTVVEAYRRARELSHVEIEVASRSPLLWGLWSFHILRGEHIAAFEIGTELGQLAENQVDPLISLPAHHSLGYSYMMLGDPASAWGHLGRDVPAASQAVYGRDLTIPFRAHGSVVLWLLGRPDQAVDRSRHAVADAREKWDLYSLSIALFNAAKVHQLRQEPEQTAEYAGALVTLAEEQEFPVWLAAGTILSGWAAARLGDREDGVRRIRDGLAAFRATGAAMIQPHFLGMLAESLELVGEIDDGLDVLEQARRIVEQTGERYFEAELHRLRGQLLLSRGETHERSAAVEAAFQNALQISRRQQALGFELRAAISAARFVCDRDRNSPVSKARVLELLVPVCARFTEGHATSDWQNAMELLHTAG